jgi:hypothetical protein
MNLSNINDKDIMDCIEKHVLNIHSKDDWKKIDAIFCQSFDPRKNEPGISNNFLANCILTKIYDQTLKPLIIQKDCVDAFSGEVKIDKIIFQHQIANI